MVLQLTASRARSLGFWYTRWGALAAAEHQAVGRAQYSACIISESGSDVTCIFSRWRPWPGSADFGPFLPPTNTSLEARNCAMLLHEDSQLYKGEGNIMEVHQRSAEDAKTEKSPARPGERVQMFINHILPEKRDEFEKLVRLIHDVALQTKPLSEQYHRIFFSEVPNEDGNYTFIFFMDPAVEGTDYTIGTGLTKVYGEEQAEQYIEEFEACFAGDQEAHYLTPMAW
jgi:hypothetical protein